LVNCAKKNLATLLPILELESSHSPSLFIKQKQKFLNVGRAVFAGGVLRMFLLLVVLFYVVVVL
jgi:hypothetical protein